MANPIQAKWPFGGVSEDFGFSDQPAGTARDAKNVRGLDPVTGRFRGGVRPATVNYVEAAAGVHKVACLQTITTANTNQTIEVLDNDLTITWQKANTVTGDTLGVACGTQGDVYSLDGNCGVMKRNKDGALMWKLALAAPDKNHVCRALYIDSGVPNDAGTDLVLVGISTGGDSTKAKFWAYVQQNDNKVDKLWELSPGGYVEEFVINNDKLFVLMNYPDLNRSYIVVYDDYLTNAPTETNRWMVPYPAHSIAASTKNGYIFSASAPSSSRDAFPTHPKATWASEDWTIKDLSSYKDRVWCNLDASIIETISITPRDLSYPNQTAGSEASAPPPDLLDGGNVRMWVDASGRGRNFYQTAHKLPILNGAGTGYIKASHAAARGAIYRSKGAPNGKGCLHFDGVTCGMISEVPASKDRESRDEMSVLPSYKGAQFAAFIVCKINSGDARRVLFCNGADDASNNNPRFIAVNSNVGQAGTGSFGSGETAGQVHLWEENGTANDASSSNTSCSAPSGANTYPLGGGIPDSGYAVITWICDGGVHDVFGTATRSLFRINGHPCDRWQSAAFSTLFPTTLGYRPSANPGMAAFAGDVYEILVINDWYNASNTQQALLGSGADAAMEYPDRAFAASQDSDLERIEGYLAHKWGIAHELPGGRVSWLTMTGQPAGGNTLVIGSTTYTFRAALTPAANEILIGASVIRTAENIVSAVNKTGEPGVDYDRRTVVNTEFRATAPVAVNSTVHYAICFRTKNPNDFTSVVSETMANASFDNGTPQASKTATTSNNGWYPHPFYIEKTATTAGGPPRTEGASTISKYWLLRSPYGILAAWDPASGKAKSVLSSNYDGAGTGVGGIGYGVRCASTGEVYSIGPEQAAVGANTAFSPSAITADTDDIRKIGFEDEELEPFSSVDYWSAGLASQTYTYPRMAVDKFDNVYIPVYDSTTTGLYVIKNESTGTNDPDPIISYVIPTTNNNAYAVAIDPTYPDFRGYAGLGSDDDLRRAEHVILSTSVSGSTRETVFKLRTLEVVPATGSPRTVTLVSVCGSQISKVTTSAITAASGPWVETDRNFVDATAFMDKIYFVDGQHVIRYNPVDTETTLGNTTEAFVGTSSGGVPQRCSLICTWNGSLVLARQAENPNQYFISKQGDAENWDISPYTLTQAQAIQGSDGSAGLPPDIINALIPWSDDLLLIGGDHSIYRITGRPSPGGSGEIHLVSDSIGIAFGRAWCKSPRGTIYFFGSRGGVYRMAPGGIPEPLPGDVDGRNKIERRLQDIDLSAYTVQMAWSDRDKGFHLIVCPYDDGGTVMEHYFWEEPKGAWWPDEWADSTIQPTCITVLDGDSSEDRAVIVGCEDSYIRIFSSDYNADDGIGVTYPIDTEIWIGPLAPKDTPVEVIFSRLQAVMANDQEARPTLSVYVTDRADFIGNSVWAGEIFPGRNPFKNFKARGAIVYLKISSSDPIARWAYEQISLDYAAPAGIKRSLGV